MSSTTAQYTVGKVRKNPQTDVVVSSDNLHSPKHNPELPA